MATDLVSSFLDRYRLAAVIQAIEEDLRGFLRQYVAPYVDQRTLLGPRADELTRRAAADGVIDATLESLVDYLDFGDSFTILNARRSMIPESLGVLVKTMTPAFEAASPVRNRVMHGRPLRPGDEEQIAKLGQALADADARFAMTHAVAQRLVDEPDWAPFVDISSSAYGDTLHNLPLPDYDETGLLGRDDELRELKRLLSKPRFPVVTIAGEGGIGKTALAIETLYDLVDSGSSSYEAVLWVTLKTEQLTGRGVRQLREAAFDFLSITGDLSDALGADGDGDIDLLAEVLEGTRTLIAVDNIESIAPAEIRRLIDELPDCQFLLTSRVGLGEMEVRLPLGALSDNAAQIMLRQLAMRRGLSQIARVNAKQAKRIVDQLRKSPLAIRWFVEAVEVGGQPDDLLRDQSAVLQFCMSTIYDSLSPDAHRVVEALLAVDRLSTIGELSLLTDLERFDVQTHIYELQRRSLVTVDSKLSETLTQSYALAEMAREHLQRFGSPDEEFGELVQKRLTEIGHVQDVMRAHDNRLALEPAALIAETDEELAVAHLLRRALGRSRGSDLKEARQLVARARDAVPGYFETYRVGGFIESDARPEEARRLYEEAHRLAPDDLKPRVAYWLAGHLAKTSSAVDEAARYASEAHDALQLPGTALRLGRIRMYQQRFDEAEQLLTFGADRGVGKARIIAETDLLDLTKRKVERLAFNERRPADALRLMPPSIERAERFLKDGLSDRRFNTAFIDLLAEGLHVALQAESPQLVTAELVPVIEALDRHFRIASTPNRRGLWETRLEWLAARDDVDAEIRVYLEKIRARLATYTERSGAGLVSGEVLHYSGKRHYGFLRGADGENIFFHRDDLDDARDAVYLTRGAEVTFRATEVVRDGKPAIRAKAVAAMLPAEQRERALRARRGTVLMRAETYLFAEEAATLERVFVHRSDFPDHDDWKRALVGTSISFDLEFGRQGPKAVSKSVTRGDR